VGFGCRLNAPIPLGCLAAVRLHGETGRARLGMTGWQERVGMKRPLLAMLLFASLLAAIALVIVLPLGGGPLETILRSTSIAATIVAPTTSPLPTSTLVPSSPQPVQRCRCPGAYPSQPESGSVHSCYSGTFTEGRCGYTGFGDEMAPDGEWCTIVIDREWYKLRFDSCPGCPVGIGTTTYSGSLQPGMLVDVEGVFVAAEGVTVFMPRRVTLCPTQ
jgi:hypothetical protein